MITPRRAAERGVFDHGWLKTAHTFSFGDYRDPAFMGYGALRVVNDDVIAPGRGFAEHGHRDMEIITYPLSGAVRHRDSLGHEESVEPGMIQRMSAGTGIRHAEFNPSHAEPTHMLQIWILPDAPGHEPRHETRAFPVHERRGRLHLLASPDGRDGSLDIHQDASMHAGVLDAGDGVTLAIGAGRRAWIHVAAGSVEANGARLNAGDGAAVEDERELALTTADGAEVLVFELA